MSWDLLPVLTDANAEAAVLGCLMSESGCVEEVLEMLREEDFADALHRRVFGAIASLARERKPADPVTVRQALRTAGPDDGAAEALIMMCDVVACRSNALHYAGIVRELSRRRRIFARIQEWLRRFGELKSDGLVDAMERLVEDERHESADAVTVSSFASVEAALPEVTWLWDGWLPRGFLTVLASAPGEGKSGLALEIVRRVLAGGAWPDGKPNAPCGPALYVDTEAAGAILRGRVREWGIPADGLNVFTSADPEPGLAELCLDNPRDWRRLARGVEALSPSLVVVDSLSGAHGRDENSSEMRVLLLKLARLARDSQAAFLVIHHLRKKSALEPDAVTLDRLRGSGTIAQFARCVWAVDRPDANDPRRRLVQIKNNLAAFPEPLGFTVAGDGIHFSNAPSTPRAETQAEKAADFLRTILRARPLPASEVLAQADEAGHSHKTLRSAADKLGVIRLRDGRMSRWFWSLPASSLHAEAGVTPG